MQLAENDDYFLQELAESFSRTVVPEVLAGAPSCRRASRCPARCRTNCMPTAIIGRQLLFENGDPFGGTADRRALEALARRHVPASALGPDRQPGGVRAGAADGVQGQRRARRVDFGTLGGLGRSSGSRSLLPAWSDGRWPMADGLVGIVMPYMLPLVLLLVALEESGIMHRVAFVVDRGFHHIGLHGGVAVPFLIGLGLQRAGDLAVAATTAARSASLPRCCWPSFPVRHARQSFWRWAASISAGWGVFAIFALTMV
jgi:hypothetical protein